MSVKLRVLCCAKCVCLCTDHFVMVTFNLTPFTVVVFLKFLQFMLLYKHWSILPLIISKQLCLTFHKLLQWF